LTPSALKFKTSFVESSLGQFDFVTHLARDEF